MEVFEIEGKSGLVARDWKPNKPTQGKQHGPVRAQINQKPWVYEIGPRGPKWKRKWHRGRLLTAIENKLSGAYTTRTSLRRRVLRWTPSPYTCHDSSGWAPFHTRHILTVRWPPPPPPWDIQWEKKKKKKMLINATAFWLYRFKIFVFSVFLFYMF